MSTKNIFDTLKKLPCIQIEKETEKDLLFTVKNCSDRYYHFRIYTNTKSDFIPIATLNCYYKSNITYVIPPLTFYNMDIDTKLNTFIWSVDSLSKIPETIQK